MAAMRQINFSRFCVKRRRKPVHRRHWTPGDPHRGD